MSVILAEEPEPIEARYRETDFDNGHYHIADGPPYITTLCGLDIRGQVPTPCNKPECPICKVLAIDMGCR